MISPRDLYMEKLSGVYQLYESKLSKAGIAPEDTSFSGVLEAEMAADAEQSAAAKETPAREAQAYADGYNAYVELHEKNRGGAAAPGYAEQASAGEAERAVSQEKAAQYEDAIDEIGLRYGVPSSLIQAVIQAESSFNADAVSSAGAQGLMQLMPGTAADMGVTDSFDAYQNIEGGVGYIRKQLDRFGDVRLALAAYNYGPGRVAALDVTDADVPEEYAKLPDHLQGYVEKILDYENIFHEL